MTQSERPTAQTHATETTPRFKRTAQAFIDIDDRRALTAALAATKKGSK